MSSYTKISIAISIEVMLLAIINIIIKIFINPQFDTLYILTAQISLLTIQVVDLIIQTLEYRNKIKRLKTLDEYSGITDIAVLFKDNIDKTNEIIERINK